MVLEQLDWDDWNDEHISHHRVSREEVGQVCFSDHWPVRVGQGKYVVYGQTTGGRSLVVVIAHRLYGIFYPVTARDMTDSERRRYRQHGKGG